jgi:hypothetical protein
MPVAYTDRLDGFSEYMSERDLITVLLLKDDRTGQGNRDSISASLWL